ncbi:MAG: hypothetical protein PSX36_06955 [bacterium]|nr:hypothetical protein [bacterium]
MTFDYNYITILGFPVFEPMTLLTNTIFFTLSWRYFKRLHKSSQDYAKQMGWFLVLMGLSSMFGAVAHAVHYQLGILPFKVLLFLMNATSLMAIFFCFRAPYTYYKLEDGFSKRVIYLTILWGLILMALTVVNQNFVIIKIHAGIVLLYSLIVHYMGLKNKPERGNRLVVQGILISFLPLIVHSFKLSIHEWFNYKDISHVLMIVSMIIIYKGVSLNTEDLQLRSDFLLKEHPVDL